MSQPSLKRESEESSEKRNVGLPVYPKPLPERDISIKVDENQFTMAEKAALRNAWRFIEPFQRRFGRETFYSFLTTHQDLINFFRRNSKINMSKLHGHAMAMMKLMGKLIHTLDNNMQFRMALDESLPSHMKNGIDSDYMKMLASALKTYILESSVIQNHNSCTLTTAFTRLTQIIEEYAQVDEARKRAFSSALRQTIDFLGSQPIASV
ncbi:hypothetical protein KR038_002873 [Drosophila bunnanda]|nr:hypothetical protein KR038_002873 [Drosophila bunnanda]